MVCKELKMKFNTAFVHNYPLVHTFYGHFPPPPLAKYFSKQIGNWYYYFIPKEMKELGIWWQKGDFLLYCGVGDNISVSQQVWLLIVVKGFKY